MILDLGSREVMIIKYLMIILITYNKMITYYMPQYYIIM
jgi:hypothetical protein